MLLSLSSIFVSALSGGAAPSLDRPAGVIVISSMVFVRFFVSFSWRICVRRRLVWLEIFYYGFSIR
jgi:hypothetical protein